MEPGIFLATEPDMHTEEIFVMKRPSRIRRASCNLDHPKVTFVDGKQPGIYSAVSLPKMSSSPDALEEYMKSTESRPQTQQTRLGKINSSLTTVSSNGSSMDGERENMPGTARRRRASFLMDLVESSIDGSGESSASRLAEEMHRMHAGMQEEGVSIDAHRRRLAKIKATEDEDLELALLTAMHEHLPGSDDMWRHSSKHVLPRPRKMSLDNPNGRPMNLLGDGPEGIKSSSSLGPRAGRRATSLEPNPSASAGRHSTEGCSKPPAPPRPRNTTSFRNVDVSGGTSTAVLTSTLSKGPVRAESYVERANAAKPPPGAGFGSTLKKFFRMK